jgi:hypothetical protein
VGLQQLQWVGLFRTRVSDAAIAELKRALPEVGIGR